MLRGGCDDAAGPVDVVDGEGGHLAYAKAREGAEEQHVPVALRQGVVERPDLRGGRDVRSLFRCAPSHARPAA